jgi:hypothetical protein
MNESNADEFHALIDNRARWLAAMGETSESVARVANKAKHLDRLSQAAVGAIRSTPFGMASRAIDTVRSLTSYARTAGGVGAASGMVSGAVDVVGSKLLDRATADTLWLSAESDDLEPVMADAKRQTIPRVSQLALEVGAATQTFSVRNVVRTAVGPVVTRFAGAAVAASVDSWMAAIGSPASGCAARLIVHAFDEAAHRVGPEYLFARKDWDTQYELLRTMGWAKPLAAVATRVAHFPLDVATDSLTAVRTLFTATSLAKTAVLTGGLGAAAAGKAAATHAASAASLSPPKVDAIGQAVNTVLTVPVIAMWTTADVCTGVLSESAKAALQSEVRRRVQQRTPVAIEVVDGDLEAQRDARSSVEGSDVSSDERPHTGHRGRFASRLADVPALPAIPEVPLGSLVPRRFLT